MATIKAISALVFIALGVWMAVLIACQFMAMRYVAAHEKWKYKQAVRKWRFEDAAVVVRPEGMVWLTRVRLLLRSGMVLLGIAAFTAVGIIVFGPGLVKEGA
ncbi:MAG: hypothetical protein AAFZ05_02350 [Pseudomonadota bacterium]